MTESLRRPPWVRVLLLAILLAALAIRLEALTRQDIWWDEARNIDVALRPFLQVATAPELDIHPPVYFWLLHGWDRLFGLVHGQAPVLLAYVSRLLSAFAGVAGVALLYPLGALAGGPLAGLLAALVGACAPFWLAESQEARMYTVGFAWLAAAAVMLLKSTRQDVHSLRSGFRGWVSRQRYAIAFVVLAALALLTHYNAVFVVVAWYLWWGAWALLRRDRWRRLGAVFAAGVAMTLLVLPVAPIALRQIPDYANPNLTIPTPLEYLAANWRGYLGGYAFDPALLAGNGDLWLWTVLGLGAVGLVLAMVAVWPRRAQAQELSSASQPARAPLFHADGAALSFLLAWLLGGLALYYVAVLDRNAFNVRYSSFVTPALYATLGVAFAAFSRWWRPAWLVAAALVLVGFWPALRADLYDSRFDREHIGDVTSWLRENAQSGDVIFVDQKYPFGFYYWPYSTDPSDPSDQTNHTGQGGELAAKQTPPARYLFVDINTLDQRLTEWARDARRVFWVQWYESDTDPRHAVHFLLDKYGRHAGEQWFQGYSVDWWDLTPPTEFVLAPNEVPTVWRFPPVQTVAASLPQEPLRPGTPLPVVIRWQRTPAGGSDRPLKARVALYDSGGARLAQADERLLNDRHLIPALWQPVDQPLNVYLLPLPEDLPPGEYEVRVLVYDADTLEPLTLVDEAGAPTGQEAPLGTVQVEPKK